MEEQFYLVWPLLLWLGLRHVPRRGRLAGIALALAAASALAMALIYQTGGDPTRVYDGTDTRAFALMTGAALAFVWPSRNLPAVSPKWRLTMDLAGLSCVSLLAFAIWRTNEYQPFYYRGGLVLVSLVTAALVAALAHPATRVGRVFAWKPLRWLGVRSYGIYLWHYPLIVLTTPVVNTVDIPRILLQVAATLGLASLSWRFVEEPIRRGALGELWSLVASRQGFRTLSVRSWTYAAGALLATGVLGASMTVHGAAPVAAAAHVSTPASIASVALANKSRTTLNPSVLKQTYAGAGVAAIGDSVMLDTAPYLEHLLPGIVIDARVGRQLVRAAPVVARLKAEGQLGSRVILELGTNGPFTRGQLASLINSLGPVQQVVLVTTRVPRPWQDAVNRTIEEVALSDPRVTVVDWYAASRGKDSFFYPDGVHLKPAGSRFYAALVAKALLPAGPARTASGR